MNLWSIFNSGRTRRWHRHPVMADYDDRLDAHQGRVARLAMALFPGDRILVIEALRHDDGESACGDIPNPVKNRLPEDMRAAFEAMETQAARDLWKSGSMGVDPKRLRLCDKLDAIMWVASKAPHLLKKPGWQNDIDEVSKLAAACGVVVEVREALHEAYGRVPA